MTDGSNNNNNKQKGEKMSGLAAAEPVELSGCAAGDWRPLCTNCAFPASHVYTTYTSRSNIRLGVCVRVSALGVR